MLDVTAGLDDTTPAEDRMLTGVVDDSSSFDIEVIGGSGDGVEDIPVVLDSVAVELISSVELVVSVTVGLILASDVASEMDEELTRLFTTPELVGVKELATSEVARVDDTDADVDVDVNASGVARVDDTDVDLDVDVGASGVSCRLIISLRFLR